MRTARSNAAVMHLPHMGLRVELLARLAQNVRCLLLATPSLCKFGRACRAVLYCGHHLSIPGSAVGQSCVYVLNLDSN